MEMQKKFYCGATGITSGTLDMFEKTDGAVEKARRLLAEDVTRKEVYIVKVVAVVRRANQPILVEKVV